MGLFGKKKEKSSKESYMGSYRIFLNASGKLADEITETVVIREDGEFLAVREAEKKFPKLKVCKVEKAEE